MAKNALRKSFYLVILLPIVGAGVYFSTDAVKPEKTLVTVKAEYVPDSETPEQPAHAETPAGQSH